MDSKSDSTEELDAASPGLQGWTFIDFTKRQSAASRIENCSAHMEEHGLSIEHMTLGFGQKLTGGDLKQLYANTPLQEKWREIFLVLKLSLAMISYGQTNVDTELSLLKICEQLELDGCAFDFSQSLQVSCGGFSHSLKVNADVVADKLLDVIELANYLACAKVDTHAATLVLKEITDRPLPYGWIIQLLNLQGLLTWAAICAFKGDFKDLAASAMIAPFVIFAVELSSRCGLGKITMLLAALTSGIVTPVVWRYIIPLPLCHIPRVWLSSILIFLPGGYLINGVYEMRFGAFVNGASQLTMALVQCGSLAIALTTGWQFFGRDAVQIDGNTGAKASLVPADMCPGFGTSWYMIFAVYNFPMLFHCFAGLNMRLRDMPKAFAVVYPSLITWIVLQLYTELPSFVANGLGMFVSVTLASFMEYMTGTPVSLFLVPMVTVLAPGSGSVMSAVSSIQLAEGVREKQLMNFWTYLVLEGISYAFGLVVALEIWRPCVHRKNQARIRTSPTYHMSYSVSTA